MQKAKKLFDRQARKRRIRAHLIGTTERPRLAVFKSNSAIYAQIIDDSASKTLVSANSLKIKKGTKAEKAAEVGKLVAEAAKAAKVAKVVFDRGGFLYAGRVKILADAARAAGLQF
ncbi:MAG: 50S ribosomal protein L18 [Patescibacteria group bacterium]